MPCAKQQKHWTRRRPSVDLLAKKDYALLLGLAVYGDEPLGTELKRLLKSRLPKRPHSWIDLCCRGCGAAVIDNKRLDLALTINACLWRRQDKYSPPTSGFFHGATYRQRTADSKVHSAVTDLAMCFFLQCLQKRREREPKPVPTVTHHIVRSIMPHRAACSQIELIGAKLNSSPSESHESCGIARIHVLPIASADSLMCLCTFAP